MPRNWAIINAVLLGLLLVGCATPSWSAKKSVTVPTSTATSTAEASSAAAKNSSDPRKMQEVMAELRQWGTLDPAAQDQLLENLRQSDPSLWPLVVEQFKASEAYRHRIAARSDANDAAQRLPPTANTAVTAPETLQAAAPTATAVAADASPAAEKVIQVSYVAPVAVDWRQRLDAAIESLETEIAKEPASPENVARHARLRMLYAAAGRQAEAKEPIPTAPLATRQFVAKEMEGLTAWLDAEQSADPSRPAADAKPALAEAISKLAESAPLLVRNLAFCTEVQSYGCNKRFEKYAFQPNQEVLLYAELENFLSTSTPKGYHTSLQSRYRISDAQGKCVAEHTFAATEEYCQNPRRDYFIGYRLHLPKQIAPGRYTMQLSINDLQSKKSGQASLEFDVTAAKSKAEKKP